MRYAAGLLITALGLAVLPGCTWESTKRGVLASLYSSFGDGYSADRWNDFDQRYEQQTQAAAEYYRQQ